MSFETEYNQLKDAVEQLESGKLSLNESITMYKDGLVAAKSCQEFLEKEKGTLKLLNNDFSEIKEEVDE